MKTNIIKTVILLLAACLLTGCFPTGQQSVPETGGSVSISDSIADTGSEIHNSENSSQSTGNPQNINEIKNVTASVKFADNYPTEANIIKNLKYKYWDTDKIKEMFIGDKTIIEEDIHVYDYDNDLKYMTAYPDAQYYRYELQDDSQLIIWPGHIRFVYKDIISANQRLMTDVQTVTTNKINDLNLLYNDAELSNFPREDAIATVNNILKELDIKNAGNPQVFAVTPEEINAYMDLRTYSDDKTGEPISRPHVGENDGIYILRYSLLFDNIPFANYRTVTNEKMNYNGLKITAILSKEKLVSFEYGQLGYDEMNFDIGETVPFTFDAQAALNVVLNNYSKKVVYDPTEIYSCNLVYLLSNINDDVSSDFMPMWEFGCVKRNSDGDITENYFEYVKPDLGVLWAQYR